MPKWIPTAPEVLREAIIVMAGALIATIIVRSVLPAEARQYFNLTGSNGNG
jgi:hypothetical protein